MDKIKLFEDFIPVGFGSNTTASFSIAGSRNIGTGYNMDTIVGPVQQLGNHIATEADAYEKNDNPDHTAEGYIKEVKKHINEKIDEACNEYANTNEAMVQVAGDKKPAGAKILAMVIVDALESSKILKPGVNINAVKDAVQTIIMDNTF
jgi:hypothetical protein